VLEELRAIVEPGSGTTSHAWTPFGEPAAITDAAGNVTSWSYNLRGFVTATSDPDAGAWSYVPNAFGELTSQTDAKNQTTSFSWDQLSRPLTRVEAEGTTTWTWGTSAAAHNIGRLAAISSPGGYSESYTWDSYGRPSAQTVTADGTSYSINQTYYSATGQLAALQYPTSTSGYRLRVRYEYSNNLLRQVHDYNSSAVFWEAVSTDAFGHVQDESFGNGVQTFTDFDQASGRMEARQAGLGGGSGLINAATTWDLNGNLSTRQDLNQSLTETFTYDSLDRLDYGQRNGVTNVDVTLDAIGNISWKQGVGNYSYHATKKRAVIAAGSHSYGYDANGNMTSRDGSTIGYTSYNLPGVINAGSNSSTLSYGAYRNRYKQSAVTAGVTETTVYIGGILEKVTRSGVTEYRHRIEGGNGTAAIYVRRSSGSPATETYFVHRDQLGSPELITNAAGAVVVRLSFGAYGERRDSDWDGAVSSADMTAIGNTTRRGFTGHEHLDSVNLIHMNGRVYEPVIGRMLSPDAVVQIGSAQSVNCYTYVWNNPLTRTDPSGWVTVIGKRIIIPATFESDLAALSLWQPSFGGDPVLRGGGGGGTKGQGQPQEQKGLLDTLKNWVCKLPAAALTGQFQFDYGYGLGGQEAQVSVSVTSHGQVIFQAQGGNMWGPLVVGLSVSAGVSGGLLLEDPSPGKSPTSSYVLSAMGAAGGGGGGQAQFSRDGGSVSWESSRFRTGPQWSAGFGAVVGAGKQSGSQWATPGVCGGI
jgi:RHS repeat-associated protein